jgi:hypothetical protein
MARQASATLTGSRGSEGRISGYVLKVIRESLGHTQERLAERLGVSAATIQGWESGRRPLMAMPAGNLMALRSEFRSLGAAPALLDALTQGWKRISSSARSLPLRTIKHVPADICSAAGWSLGRSPR